MKQRILLTITILVAFCGFAKAADKEAYVVYDNDNYTLTFYYDTNKSSYEDPNELNDGNSTPSWMNAILFGHVKTVVFDDSFKDVRPTSTYQWFLNCKELERVVNIKNLNTSSVSTMREMFSKCHSLESLDLSSFDTQNVEDMYCMFQECKSLESLDLSSFDTQNVKDMFAMFVNCYSLKSLDLSSFSTGKVEEMMLMFGGCISLVTIYASVNWVTNNARSTEMFASCTNLKGSSNTQYDADHIDKTYARIDGGTSSPGYFSVKNYNLWVGDERVTSLNMNSLPVTKGTATFNPLNRTLTLNDATITVTGQGAYCIANGNNTSIITYGIPNLNIEVNGMCQLNADDIALYINETDTRITGSGQLLLNSGMQAIYIEKGARLTSNVPRLYATATRDVIYCYDSGYLTINSSTLECVPKYPDYYGSITGLHELKLNNCRFADPGGEWKYADASGYSYNTGGIGRVQFNGQDYRGKILIEPSSNPVKYRLWVGGVQVTSRNKTNIGISSGTATFDSYTHTLTLNDAQIATHGYDDGICNGLPDFVGMPDFKIVCNGMNSINALDSDGAGLALYGNTTISGSKLGISAIDYGIHLADFMSLDIQNADVNVEASNPLYCGYNTFVYVRDSRLKLEPTNSQNTPVYGAREFDLFDCKYEYPGGDINPIWLYYNEQAEKMYYDGDVYTGTLLVVPTGPGITTGLNEAAPQIENGKQRIDGSMPLYNLEGQRVGKDYKGIVIQNGKKVVIK